MSRTMARSVMDRTGISGSAIASSHFQISATVGCTATIAHLDKPAAGIAFRPADSQASRRAGHVFRLAASNFLPVSAALLHQTPFGRVPSTRLQSCKVNADPALNHLDVYCVHLEQLARVDPHFIDGSLHSSMTFLRAVAQANHPVGAAFQMVSDLLRRLLGNSGNARIA